jgi:hypothetical protein
MPSLSRKAGYSQLLVTPWILTWVLTVPFFHIHALDIQEDFSQSQAFLPHTVFSADLPGEYSPRTGIDQRGMPGNQHAVSSHFLQYSEISIGLFSEDDDTKRKIGILPICYVHFSSLKLSPPHIVLVRTVIPEFASPPSLLLASSISSRAPPFVSC